MKNEVFTLIDLLGIAAFSVSGVFAAMEKKLDIFGIFVVAFFMKKIGGNAVFWAAVVTQAVTFLLFQTTTIAYLWYNIIGCALVMLLATIGQQILPRGPQVGR